MRRFLRINTIGRPNRLQKLRFLAIHLAKRSRRRHISHHHRKRLFIAMLPASQGLHRGFISRVARKVITAEPFDRDDFPRPQHRAASSSALPRPMGIPSRFTTSSRGPHFGQHVGCA